MLNKTERPNLNRGQAGDTLISIILSVAVISLVMVIAYILISNSLRLSQQAREREQVRNLVRGQIESLKYLVFSDGDHHIFESPFVTVTGGTPEPFCIADEPTHDASLQISVLKLAGPAGDAVSNQLSIGNQLRPADPPPGSSWPACVEFANLEAADVKIWITYKPEGDSGDEEHLFTVNAEWDGVRGGKERMSAAIRLPPPRAL